MIGRVQRGFEAGDKWMRAHCLLRSRAFFLNVGPPPGLKRVCRDYQSDGDLWAAPRVAWVFRVFLLIYNGWARALCALHRRGLLYGDNNEAPWLRDLRVRWPWLRTAGRRSSSAQRKERTERTR